jgi:glycosyltransferase 2 family protein
MPDTVLRDVRGRLPLIGVAVSVVCLAGVVWWAAHQPAPRFPDTGGEWFALVAAVALYALNTAVRAERWHRLLLQDGGTQSRRDSYALTVIGYAGNNVLPARAGDAVRVVLMAPRAAVSRRTVVGTLLAERILDVVCVVVLFVVVGYGIVGEVTTGRLEVIAGVTVAGLAAFAAAVVVVRRNQRLREWVGPMLTSTFALLSAHGLGLIALTGLIWLLETFVWMTVGAAAGFDMDLLEGLYLVALASVFSLIPSGPAYAGTQDTATIVGIKAIGGSSSLAVSYLLILRFVLQVPITLAGFALLAARYGGVSKLRRARGTDADPAADPATTR